ncbi:MAG: serine/threonine protein kinase [Deltaproteobacteria bacterium]|nr:MAG: serine/threonine protein kinase [Deltaproteobacteria bacterium]
MIEKIGRFEVLEKLGEGAMAVVYKVHDPDIDRTLAIKVLHKKRCVDKEYRRRFLREAKAAGNLSHYNIVTVYDVGEVEDRPYIAMELLEGTPLDEVMKQEVELSLIDILTIGIQIANGLDYAHSKGIVHRDIKPSNIILMPENNTIKITDFGIAHFEDQNRTQQTQMGEVLGTPRYMSPEQAKGEKIDSRSDLFSIGVILYQLLTREAPFQDNSLATLLYKITTKDPTPIGQLAPDVPVSLNHTVNKLLKKQPEKRFQSGKELAQSLTRILNKVKEKAREHEEPRIIPFRIKWTILMAAIVAFTMILSITFIYKKQYRAMTNQAIDYGASLAKFIATESAVPVLSEDWTSIEIFVHEVGQRQEFKYLTVVDYQDIIRGSSDHQMISKPYKRVDDGQVILSKTGDVSIYSKKLSDESAVFEFDAPIMFQDKEIGKVLLGLSRSSLQNVAKHTMLMMIMLMINTIAAVIVVAYVLAKRLSEPINILKKSMNEVREGDLSCRISRERNDEFGHLFAAFDRMAEELEKRLENEDSSNQV